MSSSVMWFCRFTLLQLHLQKHAHVTAAVPLSWRPLCREYGTPTSDRSGR